MARTNKIIVLAGTRNTGKTDFCKEVAFSMKNVFPKVLILDTFDSDVWHDMSTFAHPERESIKVPIITAEQFPRWKKGIARLISSDMKMVFDLLERYGKNMYVICEDSRKYIGDKLTSDQKNLVLDSKQKNMDFKFIFHSCKRIPTELLDVADILILKKTNESEPPSKMDSWPEIAQMMEALRNEKNRYAYRTLLLN